MDFGFSEEQELLRNSVADFCAKECSQEFLYKMWEDPLGYSEDMWKKMAELGWLGVLFDEKYNGLGLNFVDLTVILEEFGKALLPSPFISTVILFGQSLLYGGSEDQKTKYLSKIASGNLIGTLALLEESAGFEAQDIAMKADSSGDGYVLNGEKLLVPDAHISGAMIVPARTESLDNAKDGITLFIVDSDMPGIAIKPQKTLDMLRRLSDIEFNDVRVGSQNILGKVGEGWPILEAVMQVACTALSIEMVGGAQKALDLSVDYAKVRQQFGKPIGAFQGVKHKCAEMLLQLETARSAAYYAAWTISEDSPDKKTATSVAKAWCSDACRMITGEAIQVHGGIGFTWEYPLHMYFKRAQAGEVSFGNATFHRESIIQQLA